MVRQRARVCPQVGSLACQESNVTFQRSENTNIRKFTVKALAILTRD